MITSLLCMMCVTPLAQGSDPWPLERFDRWGTAMAPSGPSSYTLPWVFKNLSPTAIGGGAASLRADGVGFIGSWQNFQVTKFDWRSGAILGGFNALNFVTSTPVLGEGGRIYAVTDAPDTGRLFAIDSSAMDYDWFFYTFSTGFTDFHHASANVGPDGDLVIANRNANAYRLDKVNGSIVWTRTLYGGTYSTVAFTRDDQKVIVANGNSVTALNYSDGTEAWTRNLGSAAGAPGVAPSGTVVLGSDSGTIYGLDPANGAILWTWGALGQIRAAPAFNDAGIAYLAGYDQRLYAIRVADGVRLWTFTHTAQGVEPPTIGHDGRIYFCNRGGDLFCLSPAGTQIWKYNIGPTRGPLSIAPDGTLFVPSELNGAFLMIRQRSEEAFPDNVQVLLGTHVSGDLLSLRESDDDRYVAHVGSLASDQIPFVRFRLTGSSPKATLVKLHFKTELSCSQAGLPQSIRLFNFQTGQWETVDTRPTTLGDTVIQVDVDSNASRFVQAGTRLVRAEIDVGTFAGDFIEWSVGVDQAVWNLEPTF